MFCNKPLIHQHTTLGSKGRSITPREIHILHHNTWLLLSQIQETKLLCSSSIGTTSYPLPYFFINPCVLHTLHFLAPSVIEQPPKYGKKYAVLETEMYAYLCYFLQICLWHLKGQQIYYGTRFCGAESPLPHVQFKGFHLAMKNDSSCT